MLINQTNLMLEARKATINVEVLNLTELGELIRKIAWKTVYEDSLKTANQFFLLKFHTSRKFKIQRLPANIYKKIKVFIKIKETVLTSIEGRF